MGQIRTDSGAFKLEAVKLLRNRGVSVAHAACDQCIHYNLTQI
jgi:hypothetical protein